LYVDNCLYRVTNWLGKNLVWCTLAGGGVDGGGIVAAATPDGGGKGSLSLPLSLIVQAFVAGLILRWFGLVALPPTQS
jgi:hypothetical protein